MSLLNDLEVDRHSRTPSLELCVTGLSVEFQDLFAHREQFGVRPQQRLSYEVICRHSSERREKILKNGGIALLVSTWKKIDFLQGPE